MHKEEARKQVWELVEQNLEQKTQITSTNINERVQKMFFLLTLRSRKLQVSQVFKPE